MTKVELFGVFHAYLIAGGQSHVKRQLHKRVAISDPPVKSSRMAHISYPGFPEPTYIQGPDARLAVYEFKPQPYGEKENPITIMLVHGWPDIAYSWKTQIEPLVRAGYRVLVPDVKGFGNSEAPSDPALYDIRHLTDDLAAILDGFETEKAIFCGHDWGGAIVWPMAVLHPERVLGSIGLCTPHLPAPPVPPLGIMEKRFGPDYYCVRFQPIGEAEAVFTGQEEKFFRIMFRPPPPRKNWPSLVPKIYDLIGRIENGPAPAPGDSFASDDDINVYVNAYRHSGFHGGCNLYRNIDTNWEIMHTRNLVVEQPALWVGAELDLFLPPEASQKMDDLVPNLERRHLDACGHWVMWEKPEALCALISDWLLRNFPLPSPIN